MANNYNNQLATTAQFVAQYTAPVTQDQLHNAYHAVQAQQSAGNYAAALTSAGPAISSAASAAASANFAQALQGIF